jgi:hypothetical protein
MTQYVADLSWFSGFKRNNESANEWRRTYRFAGSGFACKEVCLCLASSEQTGNDDSTGSIPACKLCRSRGNLPAVQIRQQSRSNEGPHPKVENEIDERIELRLGKLQLDHGIDAVGGGENVLGQ